MTHPHAFWTLQGMVIPPLTDNICNNIHNIQIWNSVGKRKEGWKEKWRILPSLEPPKNVLLSSEVSYASWWATSKREAWRSPEPSAFCCDMGQEGAFHHLSHPVLLWAWTHQGGSCWFSRREDTFNGMKASLERGTFSFSLPTQRYPWLWLEWPRKQIKTFGPFLHNSMTTNLRGKIKKSCQSHSSLSQTRPEISRERYGNKKR